MELNLLITAEYPRWTVSINGKSNDITILGFVNAKKGKVGDIDPGKTKSILLFSVGSLT